MTNLNPGNPIQPLSVGDVVNAGVRIYRSHLKQYLTLSLIAFLWILVPIYGWAKYSEILARISRLAFQELVNQPESNLEAQQQTRPRMWSFFFAGLLVGLIFFGVYIAFAIVFGIVAVITGFLFTSSPVLGILGALILIAGFFVALFGLIRLVSRLLIVEVPLAIEENNDATIAISRSWNLTKGSVGRIQWIVVVAFLITMLFNVPAQIVASALPTGPDVDPNVVAVSSVIVLIVSLISSALITPFWQVIKAVIYYDLRARREGFGLELRDR